MQEPRGNPGTAKRAAFDFSASRWNMAVLDGNRPLFDEGVAASDRLYEAWLTVADPTDPLTNANVEPALAFAENIFKLAPMICVQSLFYGEPERTAKLADRLLLIGQKHRTYQDQFRKDFGDDFGRAIFKGHRFRALSIRHSQDPNAISVGHNLYKLLDDLELIVARRQRGAPKAEVLDPFGHFDDYRFLRRMETQKIWYDATISHDRVRALLKKHSFGRTRLDSDEIAKVHSYFARFEDQRSVLPRKFMKPSRVDTWYRYQIFVLDTQINDGSEDVVARLRAAKEAMDHDFSKSDYPGDAFQQFEEFTLADWAVHRETQLLLTLQSGDYKESQRHQRFLERVINERGLSTFRSNLERLIIKHPGLIA